MVLDPNDPRILSTSPLAAIAAWIAEAEEKGVLDAAAMALATVSAEGAPSVRYVFCRGIDERGVRFFTNYESAKGRDIEATSRAAAVFHWAALGRQARVEGRVVRATTQESDAYFQARPRGSRIASAVSPQSRPIADLADLRARGEELSAQVGAGTVERPAWWGGYWLVAEAAELWWSGEYRLHDRFRYVRGASGWRGVRLAP